MVSGNLSESTRLSNTDAVYPSLRAVRVPCLSHHEMCHVEQIAVNLPAKPCILRMSRDADQETRRHNHNRFPQNLNLRLSCVCCSTSASIALSISPLHHEQQRMVASDLPGVAKIPLSLQLISQHQEASVILRPHIAQFPLFIVHPFSSQN